MRYRIMLTHSVEGSIETNNVTMRLKHVNFTSCNTSWIPLPAPGTMQMFPCRELKVFKSSNGVRDTRSAVRTAVVSDDFSDRLTIILQRYCRGWRKQHKRINSNTKVMYFSTAWIHGWIQVFTVLLQKHLLSQQTTLLRLHSLIRKIRMTYTWHSYHWPCQYTEMVSAVGMGDPAPSPDWKICKHSCTYYVVPTVQQHVARQSLQLSG